MKDKKTARLRRARKTRARIREQGKLRLCVYRSARHIYAQVIDDQAGRVLAQASTAEKDLRESAPFGGNVSAAGMVGKRVAEKALAAGVKEVAFDRSGYRYHGRIKALADAAREQGLSF